MIPNLCLILLHLFLDALGEALLGRPASTSATFGRNARPRANSYLPFLVRIPPEVRARTRSRGRWYAKVLQGLSVPSHLPQQVVEAG